MTTAKAYAASAQAAPLAPWTLDRRAPAADDVVISIKYCGICHSDIHMVLNEWGGSIYPLVPGHEITGVVTQVGSGVTKFKPGDRVGVGCFVDSATDGSPRDLDLEQYKPGLVLTYNTVPPGERLPTYGGYSDSIVVKEGYVLKIPDALSLNASAPLLCAGITLYSPLRHWQAGPGKRVAILGMGGLGHVGVKLAAAMGAEVTVLSQTLSKQADGLRMGAKHYYATNDPDTFQKLAGSFDLIVCTVSSQIDWNAYVNLLKIDGTFVVVGAPEKPIPVGAFPLLLGRRSISGSAIGSIKETQEMLDFCSQHGVAADIEMIDIQNVNDAYKRILKSDVRFRFVIDMESLQK